MRVLKRGSITLAAAVVNVLTLQFPGAVMLILVTLGLLTWTFAAYVSEPRPASGAARLGVALASAPFAALAMLMLVMATGWLSALFLVAAVAFVVCVACAALMPGRTGAMPAFVGAGICTITEVGYLSVIASYDEAPDAWVAVFSVFILGAGALAVAGAISGRASVLWASTVILVPLGVLGMFSIGFPLLVAAALIGVAAGARPIPREQPAER